MNDLENDVMAEERISILAVDDRPDKLLTLEAMLSDMPLNIVRATSGPDALRWLLRQEFALLLLDVNMPLMDGFETAKLIRQRKNTEHLPIIFLTAYHDEVFISKGYSLGAVDYILQPVVPEILRSKISVFVDLFHKNQTVERQARWQRQRASQLQRLAEASIAINAAGGMSQMLQTITQSAREIIHTHQAITLYRVDDTTEVNDTTCAISSFSDKYNDWRERSLQLTACLRTIVANLPRATRMTNAELREHPDWDEVRNLDIPPIHGVLAAPLLRRDGRNMGVIYLSDKIEGSFTADDEAILVQLAQMGAVAIENLLSAELRESNRAKDQFIAALSHELRTPLTPVLATLHMWEASDELPAVLKADIQMLRRNVDLEARLIDDLLDLTKISRGKLSLNMETVDIHELFESAMSIVQADVKAGQLKFSVNLRAKQHFMRGDSARLQQIMWNVIKNAVKFTEIGGQITVATSDESNGRVKLEVTDTGIGMSPDMLTRIFRPFEQGDGETMRRYGGLGLGLAISKALVEAHGGTISAHSDGPGSGATFVVILPTQAKPTPRLNGAVVAEPRLSMGRALRILLVEDHVDTATSMSRILHGLGHEVRVANSIASALALSEQHTFDLLLSDLGLPDGTGLDLVRQVQARCPMPAVALTGFGMEDDIVRSREAGFSEHLTKPVNFQRLQATIQHVTEVQPVPVR